MPTIHQIYTNNISMRGTDKVKRDNRKDDKISELSTNLHTYMSKSGR